MNFCDAHPHMGLRERKKRITRLAIEQAATTLVLELGYDEVSVEMICEKAGVSPRTFFNYAGSKEGAVLGTGLPFEDCDLQNQFVAGRGGSIIEDLIATIQDVFQNMPAEDRALLDARHKIICQHPQLMQREFSRMEEAKDVLYSLVMARIVADEPQDSSTNKEKDHRDYARMVVSLTLGIAHFVSMRWALCPSQNKAGELFEEALSLARTALLRS